MRELVPRFLGLFNLRDSGGAPARLNRPARTLYGTFPIAEVEAPCRPRLAGVINGLRVDPGEDISVVEARISDGTGQLTARWLGWPSLGGLCVGREIVVEGELELDCDDRLVMFEPDYVVGSTREPR